jgi:hypothetical protein
MAPEAIELCPDIDGRADVYGFGVLFFEALTGKLPFPGPAGLELLGRILTEPVPEMTLYRPELPSAVVQLVACALAKKPSDRFADMEHLIRATEGLLLALPPAPSALRLVADIASVASAESGAGTVVSIAQAACEPEPARLPNLSATRALYSMARKPRFATDGHGPQQSRHPAMATPASRARREPRALGGYRRAVSRRLVIGAALAVLLLVTAWVGVPASSSNMGVEAGQSSNAFGIAAAPLGPLVIPLPSPSRPAPSPTASADTFGESLPTHVIVSASGQLVPTPTPGTQTADRAAMAATAPPIPKVAPHSAKRVFRGKPVTQPPPWVYVPESPFPSRAGRLSPSDF